jgi:2-phospho-L-lactate guanylyltransferase
MELAGNAPKDPPADALAVRRWSVVLPVKRLHLAKTRLVLASADRADVVLAMAVDTVAAVVRCHRVGLVVVVTDDRRAATEVTGAGALVVPDAPAAGLNPALAHGIAVAVGRRPREAVATLSADLPALRPAELAAVLDAAARHPRAMVADRSGTGTTLLTALPGVALAPAYGPGSAARHAAAGHVALDATAATTVSHDVDTVADLREAGEAGVGPHTSRLLRRLPAALR